jgi:hypothetical protein
LGRYTSQNKTKVHGVAIIVWIEELGYEKRNSTINRTIAEHISVERYEFYRTAIIINILPATRTTGQPVSGK